MASFYFVLAIVYENLDGQPPAQYRAGQKGGPFMDHRYFSENIRGWDGLLAGTVTGEEALKILEKAEKKVQKDYNAAMDFINRRRSLAQSDEERRIANQVGNGA